MDEKEKLNYKREVSIRRIALFILILCFGYLGVSSFVVIPTQGKDYSNSIVGIILLLIGYYWGSSSGSTTKSETIDKELIGASPPIKSQIVTLKSTETIDKTSEMKPIVEEVKSPEPPKP
jgi:lipopolysaccharide export LptBFGC system permease protein LptF